MKRWTKLILKLSPCLIVAGLLMAGIAYGAGAVTTLGFGDGRVHVVDTRHQEVVEKEYDLEPFHTVDIRVEHTDVTLISGDSYGVELTYYEGETYSNLLEYSLKNGVLTITDKKRTSGSQVNIFTGYTTSYRNRARILFPETAELEKVKCNISHGNVDMSGLHTGGLDMDISHGKLSAQGIIAGDTSLAAAHSTVDFQGFYTDTLRSDNSHGSISIANAHPTSHFTQSISINARHDSVRLEGILAETLDLTTEFSDIRLQNTQADTLTAQSRHGKINTGNAWASTALLTSEHGGISLEGWRSSRLSVRVQHSDFSLRGSIGESAVVDGEYGKISIDAEESIGDYALRLTTRYANISVNGIRHEDQYVQNPQLEKRLEVTSSHGDVSVSLAQ